MTTQGCKLRLQSMMEYELTVFIIMSNASCTLSVFCTHFLFKLLGSGTVFLIATHLGPHEDEEREISALTNSWVYFIRVALPE